VKIIVGMSGGVDSSVSALLLKNQGYDVSGLFIKSWEETDNNGVCKASKDFEDVVRVCDQLQIPCYSLNLVDDYQERVFQEFLSDLKAGLTPNPDILCNREIKFKGFFEKAKTLGADFIATGHYCRLNAEHRLLKGLDPEKDQSYFLYAVKAKAFESTLFPIGHLKKSEVRKIAKEANLVTAEKKDSTGICFIGKRDFKGFLSKYLGYQEGLLKRFSTQEIVGKHDGAAYYTIGQRHGMGLGGEGEPWYVVGKNIGLNEIYVERGADHPALFASTLKASNLTWTHDPPKENPITLTAKIRYRQQCQPCTLSFSSNGSASVTFEMPQRAITPGQSIVFYQDDICLGGGRIYLDD